MSSTQESAFKAYRKMPVEHLEGRIHSLSGQWKNEGISRGQQRCLQRMRLVLKNKESDAEFARLANRQKPQQSSVVTERPRQNPAQNVAYEEAYLEGEEGRGKFVLNPYRQNDIKYWAFVDGKVGRSRDLQGAIQRAAQFKEGPAVPRSPFSW